MAKGDAGRVQNQVDYQTGTAQNNLNNLRGVQQGQYNTFAGPLYNSIPTNLNNYNSLMGSYGSFMGSNPFGGSAPNPNTGGATNYGMTGQGSLYQGPQTGGITGFYPGTGQSSGIAQSLGSQTYDGSGISRLQVQPGGQINAGLAPQLQQGGSQQQSGANLGGGWNQFASNPNSPQGALYAGLQQGLSGQALVDQLNKNPATAGISYYPDSGNYGIPGGYYAAPNAQNGGQLDLIQRGGGSSSGGSSLPGDYFGALSPALTGYSDFAQTGGYSPQQIADLRARAVAPTRAIYSQAQDELARSQALQGGYSPNAAAAGAQMARQMSNTIGDQNTNANAAIAQSQAQNRLAGLSGLSGLGSLGLSSAISNRGLDLSALGGMTGLYGTTPGLSNMFGNQTLGAGSQLGSSQEMQNQLAQMAIQGQLGRAQVPGNFQQAMGNIGSGLGLIGNIAGGISGLSGLRGGYNGPIYGPGY